MSLFCLVVPVYTTQSLKSPTPQPLQPFQHLIHNTWCLSGTKSFSHDFSQLLSSTRAHNCSCSVRPCIRGHCGCPPFSHRHIFGTMWRYPLSRLYPYVFSLGARNSSRRSLRQGLPCSPQHVVHMDSRRTERPSSTFFASSRASLHGD